MRGSDRLIHCLATHADAHQRRDTRLLHRDSINGIGRLRRRTRVVRDHDELRVGLETIEHAHEMSDVLVVERGVDLVEETERARLGEKNTKQERERDECLLTTREQMNSLGALPARRSVNLNVSLEWTLGI